jgi:hypothetical protein
MTSSNNKKRVNNYNNNNSNINSNSNNAAEQLQWASSGHAEGSKSKSAKHDTSHMCAHPPYTCAVESR